jgi:truncated hemoglobin YjbI/sugar lactone lactonase YvrE
MSAIVAVWPVGTFVENLVALHDGRLVISVHSRRELQQIDRAHRRTTLTTLEAAPTGVAVVGDSLFVNAGQAGQPGWRIERFDLDGTVTGGFAVPSARFLNGLTPFRDDRLLAVDSILGQVLEIDAQRESSSVWLSHELLTKVTNDPMVPGVNGIKVFRGHVYLTSTERALVLRVPIDAAGSAGAVEVLAERFIADDLALDVEGNLYLTTHVGNTLERLSPGGERARLAGPEDGLHGSTAVAFGRTAADLRTVYVTTTGGMVAPVDGRVREATLVSVEVGAEGAALTDSLFHHLGGHRALRRAADGFYRSVLKEPLLQPLFGGGHPHHVDRLTAFFTEVFGGPAEYTKLRGGFDAIMHAHTGLGIREEQRQRFVELLIAAADAAQLPADARFRRAWAEHAEFGSRVAMQNANARGEAELHPLRTVPRWDW